MTTTIIIALCVLLLLAYVFDISSSKTKIPSVILLLLLGWTVRQSVNLLSIELPDFSPALQILGTIGLILIVLEGSLELELNKSKLPFIRSSFFGALFPMLGLSLLLAFAFDYYSIHGFKDSLTNAIPFCVISSAIAIPSASNMSKRNKEYVIYESSLSDIFAVLFFNFIALNSVINAKSFGVFGLQLLIITVISIVATIALSYMLNRIEHHVKFAPIIILIILIYAISKVYHLPGLIFIMIFGLAINNLDEIKRIKWLQQFNLQKEVNKFRELNTEAAFLIRALFFLLFGFLIETEEVLNIDTLFWALFIVAAIILIRFIQLKISKMDIRPLLFVAPRGLITILLFLSIEPSEQIFWVNKSMIIQVIILSALVMMLGLMFDNSKRKESEEQSKEVSDENQEIDFHDSKIDVQE